MRAEMMKVGRSREPKRIESGRNPLIRELRLLERDRGARLQCGLYLAWGLHLAQEALLARVPVRRAWVGPALEASEEGRRIGRALPAQCPSILRTTTRLLESIIPGCGDQGVLLLVERPRRTTDDLIRRPATLLVATHGVQDPGNIGSIARTGDALGIDGLLVLEGCADPFSSRAVRAAMGAQFRVPIASGSSDDVMSALEQADFRIVATDVVQGSPPAAVELCRPTVLFVGSEGAGLPRSILDRASETVRIPMSARNASLNVHAAATILMYEAARQRNRAG